MINFDFFDFFFKFLTDAFILVEPKGVTLQVENVVTSPYINFITYKIYIYIYIFIKKTLFKKVGALKAGVK